jgi:hypothetical protein
MCTYLLTLKSININTVGQKTSSNSFDEKVGLKFAGVLLKLILTNDLTIELVKSLLISNYSLPPTCHSPPPPPMKNSSDTVKRRRYLT